MKNIKQKTSVELDGTLEFHLTRIRSRALGRLGWKLKMNMASLVLT